MNDREVKINKVGDLVWQDNLKEVFCPYGLLQMDNGKGLT